MPLVVFHTSRVREALKAPAKLGIELLFLGFLAGIVGLIKLSATQFSAPYLGGITIDLSPWALPRYTLLSLSRGFAAYGLSLAFTLVYGTIAAHNRRAEKVMIPALDVLQAIPVLAFLPSVVLAMVRLFPTREIGLEIACIVMIFTAQVWNMTFSFHGSLRGIPQPLREVARIQRLSGWQVFRLLEVPAATIGLIWNSMMSMAGGWFFLTVNEAFNLGGQDYRLPGIGSYMAEAIKNGNVHAMVAAVIAMVCMIVLVDQVFWRPIVVWSQRFKMEEQSGGDAPQSWALSLLQKSRIWEWLVEHFRRIRARRSRFRRRSPLAAVAAATNGTGRSGRVGVALKWICAAAVIGLSAYGLFDILKLLLALPLAGNAADQDWLHVLLALGASFLRTSAAVILSAIWTLPVGILIGRSPTWSRRLQPIVQVLASFPAPMLFPLVTMALVFVGISFNVGCVALMLMGAQWYVLFNVIAGATAIPDDLKEVTTIYRAGTWQRWTRLYVPSVFPYMLTGLITAAGGAWNATIVSEYLQLPGKTYAAFGLGSLINQATTSANYPLLAASVVTMALSVVLINRVFWKRLYRLAEDRYSLNT